MQRQSLPHVAKNLGLALAAVVSGEAIRRLSLSGGYVPPMWAPAGLFVGALWIVGLDLWPGVLLGMLALCSVAGTSVGNALGVSAGNVIGALAAGAMLRRLLPPPCRFARVRELITFVGVGGLFGGTVITAGSIFLWLLVDPHRHLSEMAKEVAARWPTTFLGILTVAPAIAVFAPPLPAQGARSRWLEALALAVVTAASSLLVFWVHVDPILWNQPLAYLVFPAGVWAAMRFGTRGASAVVLATAVFAVSATLRDLGPFVGGTVPEGVLRLQAFLTLLALTCQTLASAGAERETAVEALRGSRATLDAAVAHLPLDVRLFDASGACVLQNGASTARWGDLAGARMASLPDAIPEAVALRWRDAFRRGLLGEALRSEATTLLRGEERSALEIEVPIRDGARVRGVLLVDLDTTEQRRSERDRARLEDQLRQAERMESVGRLAGGIAHDLNNLLTPILAYADLALADLSPSGPAPGPEVPVAEVRSHVEQIQSAGQRARDLTRRLLAFGRRQALELRDLDLSDEVRACAKILRRTIRENVELRLELAEVATPVRADSTQIAQILLNLGVNAQDAMPEGGVLTISTGASDLGPDDAKEMPGLAPGRYVRLTVSDTGTGMDEETRARAFEPFFTTKAVGRGTGLGLATVSNIVVQHGGGVRVRTTVGRGTTFEVYLRRSDTVAAGAPSPVAPPARAREGETVLFAEDEAAVRTLVGRILAEYGYASLEARSGEEAVAIAQAHAGRIDLLLTDVVMPGMNGRELHRRIAALRPGTRVLYMSGYTGDVLSRAGLAEEDVPLVAKPFTAEALARRVRAALDEA